MHRGEYWRQAEVFLAARAIMEANFESKDVWREEGGFQASIGALASVDFSRSSFGSSDLVNDGTSFELLAAVIAVLDEAMRGPPWLSMAHMQNRCCVREEIGYGVVLSYLINTNVFEVSTEPNSHLTERLLCLILSMITCAELTSESIPLLELTIDSSASVINADAVAVVLGIVPKLSESTGRAVLNLTEKALRNGGTAALSRILEANITDLLFVSGAALLCSTSVIGSALRRFLHIILEASVSVETLAGIISCFASRTLLWRLPNTIASLNHVSPIESTRLMQLDSWTQTSSPLKSPIFSATQLKALQSIAESSEDADSYVTLGGSAPLVAHSEWPSTLCLMEAVSRNDTKPSGVAQPIQVIVFALLHSAPFSTV